MLKDSLTVSNSSQELPQHVNNLEYSIFWMKTVNRSNFMTRLDFNWIFLKSQFNSTPYHSILFDMSYQLYIFDFNMHLFKTVYL